MMMGDEALFNLRWDAQRSALLGSMASLYREEAFVDTTIVADNKIFKAHKLLLSASSSYLRNILESVPASQHAVICMPQVSSIDMGNLLRFIYEGQIKISRRSLRPFLATAKLLRIKGMDFELNEELDVALPPPHHQHNHHNHNQSLPSPISHHQHGTKRPPPGGGGGDSTPGSTPNNNNNGEDGEHLPQHSPSKRSSPNQNDEDVGGRKSPGANGDGEENSTPRESDTATTKSKGSTGSIASAGSPASHNNNNVDNTNGGNGDRPLSRSNGSVHSEMDMMSGGEESNHSNSMEPLQLISLSRLAAASAAASENHHSDDGGALNLVDHHGSDGHSHHHHHHRMMLGDNDRDDRDEMMSNSGHPDYDDDEDDDNSFSMSIQPEVSLRESDESYSVHNNRSSSLHSSPHSALEIKQVPNLLSSGAFAGLPSSSGMTMTPFVGGSSALHNLQALKNLNKLRPLIPKAAHQSSSVAAAAAAASQFQSMSEGILMRMMRGEPPHLAHGGGGPIPGTGSNGGAGGSSNGASLKREPGGSSSSTSSVLSHHASSFFDLGHGDTHHHSGPNGGGGVAAGLRKQKRYVQCTSCSKVLSSLSALKRHMEDVHCARIQGKCLLCGRVYSSRNSLLTHVYSAHKKHHDYKAVARIIRESDFEQFATA